MVYLWLMAGENLLNVKVEIILHVLTEGYSSVAKKLTEEVEEISRRLKSAGIGFKIDNHRTCYKFALHIVGNRLFDYLGTFGDKCEIKLQILTYLTCLHTY